MASSLLPDPLQLWRDALSRLENDVNSLATGSLQSQEVQRAMHQFSNVSMGLEQAFEKAVAGYLKRAQLPNRKEVAALADALQRIEDKLDRLLPPDTAGVPRPARTRKPPPKPAQAPAATAAPVAAAAPPAAARKRRATPRAAGKAAAPAPVSTTEG